MVGAGADPEAFLGGLEIDDVGDVKVEWITAAIAGAVPHGGCLIYEDWPLLWERHRQEIRHLVEGRGRLRR
jgi:hypothetical protein